MIAGGIKINIEEAVKAFKKMTITNPHKDGDDFYKKYGVGINYVTPDKPLERFRADVELLEKLSEADADKFGCIHKGSPYYFLFWNAYDCGFYDKALFYIDAAISEDIKHHGNQWKNSQAASHLWLKNVDQKGGGRVADHTRKLLEQEIARFNGITSKPINTSDFVEKFVEKLILDPSTRSIVTAFYTFLIESEERIKELWLRSQHGGSIELPLTFLFKGGLIFESLLKSQYPQHKNGTLGNIFNDAAFQKDFPVSMNTSAALLQNVLDYLLLHNTAGIQDAHKIRVAFSVAAQLRNTTGHNLVWDDVFDKPEKLKELFEQQMNAIFYVVAKKFIGISVP